MKLQTSRLVLREFVRSDEQTVHAYASDPRVIQYTDWGPNTREATEEFFRDVDDLSSAVPRDTYLFAIWMKESPAIGCARIAIVSRADRIGDLGHELSGDYWGQGIATEVKKCLLDLTI